MPNPLYLFCDSDVLIQIFMLKQIVLLRRLNTFYGIKSVVLPEVEVEIAWHRKFKQRFQQDLDKAISDGVLGKYDDVLRAADAKNFQAIDAAIQQTGSEYKRRVDRGEAYTFAAAVKLAQPALSHDKSALDTLAENGCDVPATTLRLFDLVVLQFQAGFLTEAECDQIRQGLSGFPREFVPAAFDRASFQNGLRQFYPRMRDSGCATVGAIAPRPNAPAYATQIVLSRSQK